MAQWCINKTTDVISIIVVNIMKISMIISVIIIALLITIGSAIEKIASKRALGQWGIKILVHIVNIHCTYGEYARHRKVEVQELKRFSLSHILFTILVLKIDNLECYRSWVKSKKVRSNAIIHIALDICFNHLRIII